MLASDIDTLLELWGSTLLQSHAAPPFANHRDLCKTIDNAKVGDIPWKSFNIHYQGDIPTGECPTWMVTDFNVWYRNPHDMVKEMLGNLEFDGKMDAVPFRDYDMDGNQEYQNFMSGDWAWTQAVCPPSMLRSLLIDLFGRTYLLTTQTPMDPCLYRSFSGATRLQSLSEPVILAITPFMPQLEIHTMAFAVRIKMRLFWWLF